MGGSVASWAASHPDGPALVLPDRTITWREFNLGVAQAALRLTGSGVVAGDRIAVTLDPGREAAEILAALPLLGAAVVPLPPKASDDEIDRMVRDSGAKKVLRTGELAAREPTTDASWHEPSENDLHSVVFTSGSGGTAKGISLSHGNQTAGARAAAQALRLLPGDRWLTCLPVHHVGGLAIFLRAVATGFAVVPLPTFDPQEVIAALATSRATGISLVPTMLHRLLESAWEPTSSLRFALLGGGPCPRDLIHEAIDRRIPVAPTYGMTETASQIATLPPSEVRDHLGSVGRPVPGASIRIGTSPERSARTDTSGRIWVSGPMVSRDVTEDGWFGTSDLGRIDEDGYLAVLGRMDEVIITGGEKLMPNRVEEVLASHPYVGEAAVVGVADAEWGQRAVAAVTARGGPAPDPERIRDFLKDRLQPHEVPQVVVVVEDLPRTGPGKVDRQALRELLAHDG